MKKSKFEKAVKAILKSEYIDEREKARQIASICHNTIKDYYQERLVANA